MNNKITTILFDAGNTVIHLDYPRISQILETISRKKFRPTEIFVADCKSRFKLDTNWRKYKNKTDDERLNYFFSEVLKNLGFKKYKIVSQLLIKSHRKNNLWSLVTKEIKDTLKKLFKMKFRLGVVSNSDGRIEQLIKDGGIRKYFDIVVDSFIVGVEKPSSEIFQIALDKMKVSPKECFYVGDLYSIDVIGARKLGITPILLDPLNLYKKYKCIKICSIKKLVRMLK